QRLVRVGLAGEVGVGGDLPARRVDRLQSGTHLLDSLAAGVGAQRADVILRVDQVPQVLRSAARERALLADGAAQADDVLGGVGATDAVPPRVRVPGFLKLGGGLDLVAHAEGTGAGGD